MLLPGMVLVLWVGLLVIVEPSGAQERRCLELGVNCVCSEPMNTSSFPFEDGVHQNPADSTPETKECTLPFLTGSGRAIEWLAPPNVQAIEGASATSDPAIFDALPPGHTLAWVGKLITNLEGGLIGGDLGADFVKRVAARWYVYHSPEARFKTDGGCENSKFFQIGNGLLQGDLDEDGGTPPDWKLHLYNFFDWNPPQDCCTVGPGPDEATFKGTQLRGKWWRVEVVLINRAGGPSPNGFVAKVYLKNVTDDGPELSVIDTGAPGTQLLFSDSRTPPTRLDNIVIDLHRGMFCSGTRAFSHYMVAGWDADAGQRIGAAPEVEAETARIAFADSSSHEPQSVRLFEPGRGDEARIRALQQIIRTLEELLAHLSSRPARANRALAAVLEKLLDRELDRLHALVPAAAQYTAVGPDLGTGSVQATLTSLDENGEPIESYHLALHPGGSVRSDPFVAIPAGSRIQRGRWGDLLFVEARPGGHLVVQAPGYADGGAAVTGTTRGGRPVHPVRAGH